MKRCPHRPRSPALLLLLALLLPAASGCERDVYELRLEPSSKGLVRTLTVWREGQAQPASTAPEDVKPNKQLSAEQLRRFAELYPERISSDADIHQTFRGTFADKLPADIGGSGRYEAAESPLGSAHWYVERFRGSDDLDAQLYDQRAAADRLTDLTLGWFDEQLKTSAHREAVHRWLHQDFRQDLRNVLAFFVIAPPRRDPAPSEPDPADPDAGRVSDGHPGLRVVQYCIEHDYFSAGEMSMLSGGPEHGVKELLRFLRRKLGKSCRLSAAEADQEFVFLDAEEACTESWRKHLRATPEYARLLNAWKKAKKPDEEEPDPFKVLEQLLTPSLVSAAFDSRGDDLRVDLKVPVRPFVFSGEFDAVESKVRWRSSLFPAGFGQPVVCTAFWAVPDEKFQIAHFGSVALKDDKLATFASLYRTLAAPHRDELAKHLASLEPGDALRGRARDFVLVGPADAAAKATVERLCDLLAGNL